MILLFFGLWLPVVAALFLLAFVVIKLADKVADTRDRLSELEGRTDAIDLVDDLDFMVAFSEYTGTDLERRRTQLAGLATMPRRMH